MSDDILSVVYLLLVLPGFLYTNKNKKTLAKNLLLWIGVIGLVVIILKLIL